MVRPNISALEVVQVEVGEFDRTQSTGVRRANLVPVQFPPLLAACDALPSSTPGIGVEVVASTAVAQRNDIGLFALLDDPFLLLILLAGALDDDVLGLGLDG